MLLRHGCAAGPWRFCVRLGDVPPARIRPSPRARERSRRGGQERHLAAALPAASAALALGGRRRNRSSFTGQGAEGGVGSVTQEELEVLRNVVARLTNDPAQLQRQDLAFLRNWAATAAASQTLAQRAAARAAAARNRIAGPPAAAVDQRLPDRPAPVQQQPARRAPRPAEAPPPQEPKTVPIYYPPEVRPYTGRELRSGLKVYIGTPAYGGQVTVDYMTSVINMVTQLKEVAWQLSLVAGQSIITVGRNNAVMEFLATDCTHLLFLDADVAFTVETIRGMLDEDKEVILAPYPAKSLNEERMLQAAAQRGGNARLRDGLHYVLHAHPGKVQEALERGSKLVEVDAGPTGCMLIKREVFSRLMEVYPDMYCRITGSHAGRAQCYERWWRFFDTAVEDGEFLGEDIAFCRRWRAAGGTIWADLGATMTHVGRYAYMGNMLEGGPLEDLCPK